jgi:hypothetical protein
MGTGAQAVADVRLKGRAYEKCSGTMQKLVQSGYVIPNFRVGFNPLDFSDRLGHVDSFDSLEMTI